MRKRKHIINLFAAVALLVGCNESLEDTYSDYAGDGKIRYVAKCTEVHVTPKWEGLVLEWINGTDATIDKIKVVWTVEDRKDSVFLPNTSTSFELKNLTDGTFRFDVCAVDSVGNQSLTETTYGRPYTRQHEIMLAFTRGVLKSYFLKNKMIFFSDMWNENIEEMKLQYKNTQGETQYYLFDKETSYNNLVTIDDVSMNPADTVYVLRKGRLEDCPDIIEFDPYAISRKKNFSAGFVNAIHLRYGKLTDTKEQEAEFEKFVEEVEELEFDYDIETFEDVLYCPKLKKLVFGKNRYLDSRYGTEYDKSLLLGSEEKSVQVLNKANEILGLTIDYYGGWEIHYFNYELPYMTYIDYPQLPSDLKVIEKEALREYSDGNRIYCSPTDPYAKLNNLLDDDAESVWATTSYTSLRDYEMQMELLEPTEIRGIKVAQALYNPRSDQETPNFTPSTITIETSVDGANWDKVTFLETNTLGRGSGEVTLLPIAEGSRKVRYIRFFLRDRADMGGNCMIKLGDILPYK